jgi:hypothetical protein
MKVYQAINAVQAALSQQGIEKTQRNNQGAGYNFRGIDQVYNTLSPLLAKHGLCILPRVVKSEQAERLSAKGGTLIYSYVTMEFDLVCADDGSKHTICTVGEAFDSGDKSMNKAMSAAYKYACFQSFAIPTEGDNDADAHTHEVAPRHSPVPETFLTPARMAVIDDVAQSMREKFIAGDVVGAYEEYIGITESDEKIALWAILRPDSKLRSAIKAHGESLKGEK